MRTARSGPARQLGIGFATAVIAAAAPLYQASARKPEAHDRTHFVIHRGRQFAVPPSRSRVYHGVWEVIPTGNSP